MCIDYEEARELLDYDPETGKLTWKDRDLSSFKSKEWGKYWNKRYGGTLALESISVKGYLVGKINDVSYKAHRVAYLLYHGVWPKGTIDHINGDKTDNRISNLRDVSSRENNINRPLYQNNKSSVAGVSWNKSLEKWVVYISSETKREHLGYFESFKEAVKTRKNREKELGYHPNYGRKDYV